MHQISKYEFGYESFLGWVGDSRLLHTIHQYEPVKPTSWSGVFESSFWRAINDFRTHMTRIAFVLRSKTFVRLKLHATNAPLVSFSVVFR